MAYTVVDYGTETPSSIDRFGTEQEYDVFGRNGSRKVSHAVVPVRRDPYVPRHPAKEKRRFWWTVNRYINFRTYRMLLHNDRTVEAHLSADGRVQVVLDGQLIYQEKKRRRRVNGEPQYVVTVSKMVEQEYAADPWEARREAREERLAAVRDKLKERQ